MVKASLFLQALLFSFWGTMLLRSYLPTVLLTLNIWPQSPLLESLLLYELGIWKSHGLSSVNGE